MFLSSYIPPHPSPQVSSVSLLSCILSPRGYKFFFFNVFTGIQKNGGYISLHLVVARVVLRCKRCVCVACVMCVRGVWCVACVLKGETDDLKANPSPRRGLLLAGSNFPKPWTLTKFSWHTFPWVCPVRVMFSACSTGLFVCLLVKKFSPLNIFLTMLHTVFPVAGFTLILHGNTCCWERKGRVIMY